jgi:hypothetical protein
MDGVAEPDPYRGDVYGAEVHEVALVVAGRDGAALFQQVKAAFPGVSISVSDRVEPWGATALGAQFPPVGLLVAFLGNYRLDLTFPQVGAVLLGRVGLVAHDGGRPGPWTALPSSQNTDLAHDLLEHEAVVALSGADHPSDGAAAPVRHHMDLRGEAASGPAKSLAIVPTYAVS